MKIQVSDYFDVSVDYLLGGTDYSSTQLVTKSDLPQNLLDLGYEEIEIAKEINKRNLPPDVVKSLLNFAEDLMKKQQKKSTE